MDGFQSVRVISGLPISPSFYFYNACFSSYPIFDHVLGSSHRYDSNKWPNSGFGEEITKEVSIEVNSMYLM